MKAIAECSEMDQRLFSVGPPPYNDFVNWRLDFSWLRCVPPELAYLAHEAVLPQVIQLIPVSSHSPICIDIIEMQASPADNHTKVKADLKWRVYYEQSS